MKRIIFAAVLILVLATSCNLPAGSPAETTTTIENKVTQAWVDCVNATGVLAHVCISNKLNSFAEATPIEAGFAVPADTLVLVNDSVKGSNPFIINGNQSAVEGTDFERVAGAQTGYVSTYYVHSNVVMAIGGKQIKLNQPASLYVLFPGWPNWPPVLPTQLAVIDPNSITPPASTSTPEIIPTAFTSATFLNLWYSQNESTSLIGLLDQAYGHWGKYYGGEFTVATYSFVRAGTIIWPVSPSNIVDLSKQPIDPYGGCFSTFNEADTVIYTVCDIYVIEPPFKYLTLSDWENFQLGMLPAVPTGIHP